MRSRRRVLEVVLGVLELRKVLRRAFARGALGMKKLPLSFSS